MTPPAPKISVVAATHNRPERLDQLLESLRKQTIGTESFEVVIVDDASGPETLAVLRRQAERGGLNLVTIRRDVSGGPAAARNAGWEAASSPLVVFTDDDCVLTPDYLNVALASAEAHPGAFVQGRTIPNPEEEPEYNALAHSIWVEKLGPSFETCNIMYPRHLLEQLGGFDQTSFTMPGGEDVDLGWRFLEAGIEAIWAPDMLAYHAVSHVGLKGKLRIAARWHESILVFARYPERGRSNLYYGVFWRMTHAWLARFLLALVLPKRLWPLRWWLAAPYVEHMTNRSSGPLLVPYFIAHDMTEMIACIRGSIRYKTFVL